MAVKNLDVNNFVRIPSPNDRVIFIYDKNNNIIMNIDPYSSVFFNKKQFVYIMTDGKVDYNNILEFNNEDEGILALSKLNDVKKYFIDGMSLSGCTSYVTFSEFILHTGNTDLHLTSEQNDGLDNSNNPSTTNYYLTLNDVSSITSDTKTLSISTTDNTDNFLFNKIITGNTILNLSIQNQGNDERLLIDIDLNDYIKFNELSLSANTDVSLNNININDVLKFDGSEWVNSALTLSDISDYNDNNYVHTTTNENIFGIKTFEIVRLSGFTNLNNIEQSLNFDTTGQIIEGNIYKFNTIINGSLYCDAFRKDLTYSCIWHYSVRSGITNIRVGTISACWDDTGNSVVYSELSTVDIGNTNDINFEVNMDVGNTFIRLFANCTGQWNIRMVRINI